MIKMLFQFIKKHISTMMLYATVGLISAIVNFSSFTILWKLAGLNYQVAVSIAFALSVLVHFTANRNVTFRNSDDSSIKRQVPKYALMVTTNYLITMCVMYIVVEVLKLSPFIGLLCSIGCTVGVGYCLSRFWVFKVST
jgi:putative flippase GtrA